MLHLGTQSLETDRLALRRYRMSDAEDMFANWATDPEAARFWSWEPHKNIQETKSLLAQWICEYDKPNYYHWVIVHKKTEQAIGYLYLADIDDREKSASVHYLISPKYWNQGMASEALKKVLDFAFDKIGFAKILSWHHADNPASGRVMEKCGMNFTKSAYSKEDCKGLGGEYLYYQIKK